MPHSLSDSIPRAPLIGFAAFSGTGKTTLLEKLIPIWVTQGLNIGMVKASHHDIDPDKPGKDSYRLRKAGSCQLILSTPKRSICYTERAPGSESDSEPTLEEQLQLLDHSRLDLVVIEGFRGASIPKIELHRRKFQRPLLHPEDEHIIAIAWDYPPEEKFAPVPQLDINNPEQIAQFIVDHILSEKLL